MKYRKTKDPGGGEESDRRNVEKKYVAKVRKGFLNGPHSSRKQGKAHVTGSAKFPILD